MFRQVLKTHMMWYRIFMPFNAMRLATGKLSLLANLIQAFFRVPEAPESFFKFNILSYWMRVHVRGEGLFVKY